MRVGRGWSAAMTVLLVAATVAGCGGSRARRAAPPTAVTVTSDAPTTASSAPPTSVPPAPVPSTTVIAPATPSGQAARVNVAVATVWASPSSPRSVDAPAIAVPVDIRRWLSSMTVSDMRGLDGRAETQVLLGDEVVVVGTQGEWAHVVAPDQPTRKNASGYPGWVPLRQLTFALRPPGAQDATVIVPLTHLIDPATRAEGMEISFGTRLPVAGPPTNVVPVVLPDGGRALLRRDAVSVTDPGEPALAATGASLVASARAFEGTPYLWAGASGFAFDCSGLTHLDYRVHGLRIPRDAEDQAEAGRTVTRSTSAPGDLFFYARNGNVHHVAMVVDAHTLVQAPAAGEVVNVVSPDTGSRPAEFSGARRYLD